MRQPLIAEGSSPRQYEGYRCQRADSGSVPMTCVHCGTNTMTMTYTLHCTPETRDARDVELHLCTDCLRSLCAEPDIELVEESTYVVAD